MLRKILFICCSTFSLLGISLWAIVQHATEIPPDSANRFRVDGLDLTVVKYRGEGGRCDYAEKGDTAVWANFTQDSLIDDAQQYGIALHLKLNYYSEPKSFAQNAFVSEAHATPAPGVDWSKEKISWVGLLVKDLETGKVSDISTGVHGKSSFSRASLEMKTWNPGAFINQGASCYKRSQPFQNLYAMKSWFNTKPEKYSIFQPGDANFFFLFDPVVQAELPDKFELQMFILLSDWTYIQGNARGENRMFRE